MINKTQLAKSLIYIATGTTSIVGTYMILSIHSPALEELSLVDSTETGYVLREPAASLFIKKRFKAVLDSFVIMKTVHNIPMEKEITYLFGLLEIAELPAYLSSDISFVRDAAKARFDYLVKLMI